MNGKGLVVSTCTVRILLFPCFRKGLYFCVLLCTKGLNSSYAETIELSFNVHGKYCGQIGLNYSAVYWNTLLEREVQIGFTIIRKDWSFSLCTRKTDLFHCVCKGSNCFVYWKDTICVSLCRERTKLFTCARKWLNCFIVYWKERCFTVVYGKDFLFFSLCKEGTQTSLIACLCLRGMGRFMHTVRKDVVFLQNASTNPRRDIFSATSVFWEIWGFDTCEPYIWTVWNRGLVTEASSKWHCRKSSP